LFHTLGDIPELIKKEKYLQDTPACIDRYIYKRTVPAAAAQGLSSLHEHQFIEISYVEKGSGLHRIWNESSVMEPGALVILNAAVPHGFFSDSDTEPLIVRSLFYDIQDLYGNEITEIGGDKYLFGLFAKNNFVVSLSLKPKYLKTVSQKFDEIELETEEKKLDWKDVIRSQIALLLLQLKRLAVYSSFQQTNTQNNTPENTILVSEVLRLVQEHYADPLFSMKNVSELLHISSSSISRSFRDITGKYFSDYLCFYRIRQAVSLFTETELSNEEASFACGYSDLHSFYKQFKQLIGTTPGDFRKQKDSHLPLLTEETANSSSILYMEIFEKMQQGKRKEIVALVTQALEEGLPPDEILSEALVKGMNTLGNKFQTNEVFVSEVLGAANAMNTCMEILKPYLSASVLPTPGRAIICTVKGDIHNIGKNLVRLMLEAEGIECIDLGVDVPPAAVVDAVREHHVNLVCISALLTTTMSEMEAVVKEAEAKGIREKVFIMVGGAPIKQEFCDKIGADCYTSDAASASEAALAYLKQ